MNIGAEKSSVTNGPSHFDKAPLFSIVIGTHNDWVPLETCLQSLAMQTAPPAFEVVVVDDGSRDPVPESIWTWVKHYSLVILRQERGGISGARNRGIQASSGSVLLFADADCKFATDCLANLAFAISASQHLYFQLHLVGSGIGAVGRAERLRLMTLQQFLLRSNGCIRYLNTAGFAIRREAVPEDGLLFNPAAHRAEDTLLLAHMIKIGQLPYFVDNAKVEHTVSLPLWCCLHKDARSAYLEAKAYSFIASRGIKIQVSCGDRWTMLRSMWRASGQRSIGRLAWCVLVMRQGLRLLIFWIYSWWPRKPKLESDL